MGDDALVLLLMLAAGLIVACAGGMTVVLLYAFSRTGRGPFFAPIGRPRPAPDGITVAGAFAVFVLMTPIVHALLARAGFFQAVYGNDFPSGWPDKAADTIRTLWSGAIAFPLQLGLMIAIVRTRGGLPEFVPRGWVRHAVAGYLTWLLVTPVAFCVFALANMAHFWLTGQPPDKHPLTALGDSGGTREWTLFVLQTVLLAPILEEFLFRGLILPWLAQTRPPEPDSPIAVLPPHRPLIILLLCVSVAVILHSTDIESAWKAGDRFGVAMHFIPAVFFVALLPLDLLARRSNRLRRSLRIRSVQQLRAIVASSALFAAVHAQVWPSPVPLFVLALGLGYLYIRTRSLVGPVVVHGMFNAVSAVYLLLGGPA